MRPKSGIRIASRHSQSGFTLIELLIVMSIIAVLVGAVLIGLRGMTRNSMVVTCRHERKTIETAAQAERDSGNGSDYHDLSVLISGGYLKDRIGIAAHFGNPNSATGEVQALVTGKFGDVAAECNV